MSNIRLKTALGHIDRAYALDLMRDRGMDTYDIAVKIGATEGAVYHAVSSERTKRHHAARSGEGA
ncbi:hypothetical protein [Pararhizobium mangrovi]|uniref:Transcriptional regulator n=1 Tax=Pararhizobium mangrovi TaxID=2590452 RepID=A0A506U093_9HYPH|nr:hypothetical protein [Pararhizobium mangrovi]TPW26009.1 hypothetical protein FJU11_16465 [Pararhizobium mangrovi]